MKINYFPSLYFRKVMFFLIISTNCLVAQTINPIVLEFSEICAGGPHPTKPNAVFNEYEATFTIDGFAADVTFKVVLSDPTGGFSNPTATTPLAHLPDTPPDTATQKTLVFAIPTNIVGSSSYKLKVVSSTNVYSQEFTAAAPNSTKSFPAYYLAYNTSFIINNNQSSASFCFGSSLTLSVYNPTPSIPNSSPANYPQLTYLWYKDGQLISGQTTSSIVVNATGKYYAKLDYGLCSDDNFRSQEVTVSGATGAGAVIVSSSGNPFCSGQGNTTLSVTVGNSYVWKKDNVVIPGAITSTYQTNTPGVYSCDVDFGGCKSTGSIDLKVFEFTSSITGVEADKINYINEGETITVSLTSTAVSPTYQWLLNTSPIPNETTNTLNITSVGKYIGSITQNSGCIITKEYPFEIRFRNNLNVPQISNIVTPNGDGINDTWIIPDQYISGTNTNVMILSSIGEIVFETQNYDNYAGWPQSSIEFSNFNPVYYYIITPNGGSAKKGSITLVK